MRTRKLRIFLVVFMAVVVLASYGLALLRTYVFKPPSGSTRIPSVMASIDAVGSGLGKNVGDQRPQKDAPWKRVRSSRLPFPTVSEIRS